jgi:hypothetical protein
MSPEQEPEDGVSLRELTAGPNKAFADAAAAEDIQ